MNKELIEALDAIEKEKDRYLRVIGELQMQLDLPSVSIGVARHSQSELCLCARQLDCFQSGYPGN